MSEFDLKRIPEEVGGWALVSIGLQGALWLRHKINDEIKRSAQETLDQLRNICEANIQNASQWKRLQNTQAWKDSRVRPDNFKYLEITTTVAATEMLVAGVTTLFKSQIFKNDENIRTYIDIGLGILLIALGFPGFYWAKMKGQRLYTFDRPLTYLHPVCVEARRVTEMEPSKSVSEFSMAPPSPETVAVTAVAVGTAWGLAELSAEIFTGAVAGVEAITASVVGLAAVPLGIFRDHLRPDDGVNIL